MNPFDSFDSVTPEERDKIVKACPDRILVAYVAMQVACAIGHLENIKSLLNELKSRKLDRWMTESIDKLHKSLQDADPF